MYRSFLSLIFEKNTVSSVQKAIQNNNVKILENALSTVSCVEDVESPFNWLVLACFYGNTDMCKQLQSKEASILSVCAQEGLSAQDVCLARQDSSLAELQLTESVELVLEEQTAVLRLIMEYDREDQFSFFLSVYTDMEPVFGSYNQQAEQCLTSGATKCLKTVQYKSVELFHMLVYKKQWFYVTMLLDHIDEDHSQQLHNSSTISIATALLRLYETSKQSFANMVFDRLQGLYPTQLEEHNEQHQNQLLEAVEAELLEFVKRILVQKPSLQLESDIHEKTPLHGACCQGNLSIVKVQVEKGASPIVYDVHGNTPMHYASSLGHQAIVEYLLPFCTTVDMFNSKQQTPLHCAVMRDEVKLVEQLLLKGADVHRKDIFSISPLKDALLHGKLQVLSLLLKNSGEPASQPTEEGKTTLMSVLETDYAQENHTAATIQESILCTYLQNLIENDQMERAL